MYPVTTVVIQNVVQPHQFGTATGTLNFSRQLGGSIVVAFGAIVLGALGPAAMPPRSTCWAGVRPAPISPPVPLGVRRRDGLPVRLPAMMGWRNGQCEERPLAWARRQGLMDVAETGGRAAHEAPSRNSRRGLSPIVEARSVIMGILLAMFLAALNQTIVATALPTIGRDLHDFENLSWTVTAYLLTSTVVASLYGKLSDIHGRRAMMLTGLGLFIAGSAICALAPNMLLLMLGRGLQGLGGGGIMPLAQMIIADVSTPRERGRYQALIGSFWVGAGIGGPVVGGFIAEHLPWSLIFWINVPLGVLGGRPSTARSRGCRGTTAGTSSTSSAPA